MEVTIEQNITTYDVVFDQETTEFLVDIKNQIIVTETIIEQIGVQGFSAYEIDVQNGFVGTEIEWSNSFKRIKIVELPELP
jgi:hypothetical protein